MTIHDTDASIYHAQKGGLPLVLVRNKKAAGDKIFILEFGSLLGIMVIHCAVFHA